MCRKRLTAFYVKHNPDKLREVDQLVKKYEANEELLFTRLHRKYNALSVDSKATSKSATIDESEFLYEESEDDDTQADEMAGDADNEAGSSSERSDARTPVETSSADSEVDDGFHVVKQPVATSSYYKPTMPASTPPVSPRESAVLAHNLRHKSVLIKDAINEARRAQEERINARIAKLLATKSQQSLE